MRDRNPEASHSTDTSTTRLLASSSFKADVKTTDVPTLPNDKAERQTGKMPEGTTTSSVEKKTAERGRVACTSSGMTNMIVGHSEGRKTRVQDTDVHMPRGCLKVPDGQASREGWCQIRQVQTDTHLLT